MGLRDYLIIGLSFASMAIAAIVWAVRQEGAIKSLKRELEREIELLTKVHDNHVEQVRSDLSYIRQRIDQALAGR